MVVCVQREVAIRHSPVQTAGEAVVSPETHTREEGKVMHASHHAYYSTHAETQTQYYYWMDRDLRMLLQSTRMHDTHVIMYHCPYYTDGRSYFKIERAIPKLPNHVVGVNSKQGGNTNTATFWELDTLA